MPKAAKVRFSDGGKGFLGRAPRATAEQKKAREDRTEALSAEKARRLDTRRKVVLGGALMARARQSPQMARSLQRIIDEMPERDRALFEGWLE